MLTLCNNVSLSVTKNFLEQIILNYVLYLSVN